MSVFSKLSQISRARKLALFNEIMRPTKETQVLDVGAEVNPNSGEELQFVDIYISMEE